MNAKRSVTHRDERSARCTPLCPSTYTPGLGTASVPAIFRPPAVGTVGSGLHRAEFGPSRTGTSGIPSATDRERLRGVQLTQMNTADWYRWFATAEARGASPCLKQWALGIADDRSLVALIDQLPETKRQPNLVLAAARFAGITPTLFDHFRDQFVSEWPRIRSIVLERRTQTNEPGRCAVLLPILAALPQPLALLEVGASAGLCLYPDRFSYEFGDEPRVIPSQGPGAAVLRCTTSGTVPLPSRLPEIVWRAGIDLNPLDVDNVDQMRWLDTLVWPEQEDRRDRLRAAVEMVQRDPPNLIEGDLLSLLDETAASAPDAATLVIFHSAVLAYLSIEDRGTFAQTVGELPGHWISNEGVGVVPFPNGALPAASDPTRSAFVVALDGVPMAYSGPHGQWLEWFGPAIPFGPG